MRRATRGASLMEEAIDWLDDGGLQSDRGGGERNRLPPLSRFIGSAACVSSSSAFRWRGEKSTPLASTDEPRGGGKEERKRRTAVFSYSSASLFLICIFILCRGCFCQVFLVLSVYFLLQAEHRAAVRLPSERSGYQKKKSGESSS